MKTTIVIELEDREPHRKLYEIPPEDIQEKLQEALQEDFDVTITKLTVQVGQ